MIRFLANMQASLSNGRVIPNSPRKLNKVAKQKTELRYNTLSEALEAIKLSNDDVCTTISDISIFQI